MKNFETKIRSALKSEICFERRDEMKSKIMMNSVKPNEFDLSLLKALRSVKLSVNKRVLMKEKLVMFIEASQVNIFDYVLNSVFLKRSVAGFSLFVFLFTLVIQPFSDVETVKAYTPTKITTFSGSVTVDRNGQLLRVTKDFSLMENDVLQTGPAGFAEIVFSDDSVSRLSSSTRVNFAKLDNRVVNSNVEMNLRTGELWVNTFGISGSASNFIVNARDVSTLVKSSSVFNIESSTDFVRVVALENNLNLQLINNEEYIPANLKMGQLVKVRTETPVNTFLDQVEFKNKLSDLSIDWILSNYKQDEFYIDSLDQTRIINLKEKAGITSDSYFYPVKEFQRAARLAVTFNPVRQAELELHFANQKLTEAEVLLEKGDKVNAKKTLDAYSDNMVKVAKKVSDLTIDTNARKEDVQRLKDNLVASVAVPKRSVSNVLPNEDKYEFKQVLNNTEVLIAENKVERKIIELSQLTEILNEAKLLAESNQKQLAGENLTAYLAEIERIGLEFSELTEEDKALVALAIIESNLDGIEALDSIKDKAEVAEAVLPFAVVPKVEAGSDKPVVPVDVKAPTVEEKKAVEATTAVTNAVFQEKLEAVKEVTKVNLNTSIEAAGLVKTPTLVNEINKLNSQIDLSKTVQTTNSNISVSNIDLEKTKVVVPQTNVKTPEAVKSTTSTSLSK